MSDRLTAAQAADIAARHRLTLSDALALRGLTDDPDEADQLAAKFADAATPDSPSVAAGRERYRQRHAGGTQ